jgi:hypothetical protein
MVTIYAAVTGVGVVALGGSGFSPTFQSRSGRSSPKRLVGRVNLPLRCPANRHHERPVLLRDAPREPRVDRLLSNGPLELVLANPVLAPLMEPGWPSSTGNDCPYIFRIAHRGNHANLNISELQAEKFGTHGVSMCSIVLPHAMVAAARPNYSEERPLREGCGHKSTRKREKSLWMVKGRSRETSR